MNMLLLLVWIIYIHAAIAAGLVSEVIPYTTLKTSGCGNPVSLYINKTYDNNSTSKGVIIAFPGTAFMFPRQFYFEHEAFAKLGYTFYQINTRVYNTHRTLAGCAMQDGRDAIKLITETLEYNQTFFIYAGSAGGAVSLNSLTVHGSKFRAMALVGPVVDTLAFFMRGGQKRVLKSAAYAKQYSPMTNVNSLQSKDLPPMHFFVGTKDTSAPLQPNLVNFAHQLALRRNGTVSMFNGETSTSADALYRIAYYENEIHGFQDLLPEQRRNWLRADIIRRTAAFFNKFTQKPEKN